MAGQRQTPGFGITGLPEMLGRLNSVIVRMEIGGAEGIRAVAMATINEAKLFCPVDSGRLRASLGGGPDGVANDGIRNDPSARGPGVIIGTHVDYAAFVEFGTRFMAAQPYLRPALEVMRARLAGEVAVVIRHAVPELSAA